MTQKSKTQRPKSGQRGQENHVDAEIRRAARRAGLKAHPKKLSLDDVRDAVVQGLRDARLGAEFKAATGIDPEHVEHTPAPTEPAPPSAKIPKIPSRPSLVLPDRFRAAVSAVVTGGLWTATGDNEADSHSGGPFAALAHTAAVQTKILAHAIARRELDLSNGFGLEDWCPDYEPLTDAEIVTALHSLSVLLHHGKEAIDSMLCYDRFGYSSERVDAEAES